MPISFLQGAALRPINHLLQSADWARKALTEHAGKGAEVTVAGLSLRMQVGAHGELEPLAAEQQPAVRIELPAAALAALPASTAELVGQARIEGDAGFAETIALLARHLRPDIGGALSPVMGQALAHRVERGLEQLLYNAQDGARRLGQNLREYAAETQAPTVARAEFEAFSESLQEVQEAVRKLRQRVERL
jgi:ubiquinone biosynthesis accessory factor UbiJ